MNKQGIPFWVFPAFMIFTGTSSLMALFISAAGPSLYELVVGHRAPVKPEFYDPGDWNYHAPLREYTELDPAPDLPKHTPPPPRTAGPVQRHPGQKDRWLSQLKTLEVNSTNRK